MAKLCSKTIGVEHLLEYLNESSDFGFELRALKLVRSFGLLCDHGGLYEDPVTKKSRQFDIRAIARADGYCVRLAIECKNVGENFPLLVSCTPRHVGESFHEVAVVGEIENGPHAYGMYDGRAHVVWISDADTIYKEHAPVGKSLAQIGRESGKAGKIHAADQDIFDKWAQSLASADDLVNALYWDSSDDAPTITYVAAIPMVVVPDGRLWMVEYDHDGERRSPPVQTNRCSLFVNREYMMHADGRRLRLSHVEFVTLSGLGTFVSEFLKDKEAMEGIFPQGTMREMMESLRKGR